ncbi:hypothetical protein M8A51_08020 [Schlegelella sp. S2-27]|uniref:Uncharacterized protein n=1 Tax=Caldimonas mangrovi TaxID=2944811 RepID=A0ABT0YL66_9BURK|nr:hypothetical protein [Caldimonas mangrovi]MCM5679475.1 hypothetical protein [Caldimonas mangrovi]
MSNRSLWMALGAGLLAGASIAAYRARQRVRRSAVGPEYLDRWSNEASSDLSTPGAGRNPGIGTASPTTSRSPLTGNGAPSSF